MKIIAPSFNVPLGFFLIFSDACSSFLRSLHVAASFFIFAREGTK